MSNEKYHSFTITETGVIKNTYSNAGFVNGASIQDLTKKQIMDLHNARKKIIEQTRKEKGKVLFIDIDGEGECSIEEKFTRNVSLAAFKNGDEIPLPESKPEQTTGKKAKSEQPGDFEESLSSNKKTNNKKPSGDVKPEKTMSTETKKKAKPAKKAGKAKPAKKAAKKAKANNGEKKLPEGKKMKITVKKAIELAKKGSMIYRASNGSPFGLLYLNKVQNVDREMELIVRAPEK